MNGAFVNLLKIGKLTYLNFLGLIPRKYFMTF